jgi:hypothetical protein
MRQPLLLSILRSLVPTCDAITHVDAVLDRRPDL